MLNLWHFPCVLAANMSECREQKMFTGSPGRSNLKRRENSKWKLAFRTQRDFTLLLVAQQVEKYQCHFVTYGRRHRSKTLGQKIG